MDDERDDEIELLLARSLSGTVLRHYVTVLLLEARRRIRERRARLAAAEGAAQARWLETLTTSPVM